jgi:RNA polymerase sigma-70 factor (ECF subfamily)
MADLAILDRRRDHAERVAELYSELRNDLYRHLVANGARPQVAQDLAQEAFLRLHAALLDGTEVLNPRAWVFTVAHNLAANHRRRPAEHDLPDEINLASTSEGDNPEAVLLQSERMARIDRAFVQLSRQQRLCLSLRAEGFQYKQIAGMTGLGVSTVGEFLRRAICRLREALGD